MQSRKYKGLINLDILCFQDSPAIWIENCIVLDKVHTFNFSLSSPSVAKSHTMYLPTSY